MTHDPGGRSTEHGRPDLDWQQIADALWLTVCRAETDREAGRTTPAPPSPAPTAGEPPRAPDPPRGPAPDAEGEDPEPEDKLAFSAPRPVELVGVTAPPGETPGRAIAADVVTPAPRLTAVAPPTAERALSRALRPFKRTSPSPVGVEIDEETTAERAAREGLWLPSCVPVRERWMDMVLVVDRSSSMVVWRQTVGQLVTVLERTGAFRTVRVQRINFDHPLPAEPTDRRDGADRGRSPIDGIPPRGRRAVLVLTDGIGAAWGDETGKRALGRWARHATVAVLHVLNQGHWHHTGLMPERVRVRVPEPGAPNGTWHRTDGAPWPGGEPPVPVLELDARWLHRWAQLVTRPSTRGRDTLALLPGVPAERWEREPEPTARDRVFRFRATASPSAFTLASRLAAAPLNIPVMEFVQGMHEPQGSPGDLAEILLGGLLRKVGAADPMDETGIGYEFHSGVRELLLSAGMRDESLYILRSVLDRLGRRWKPLHVLRDALNHPSEALPDLPETERLLPYMRVQEKVYQALSGPYLEGARTFHARVLAQNALGRSEERRGDPVEDPPSGGSAVNDSMMSRSKPSSPKDESSPPSAHGTPGAAGEHPRGSFVPVTAARSLPAVEERRAGDPPAIWGNVPPRNNNFTGRQALLDTLHERLSSEGTAAVLPEALHGLGGVGKSQIALEYVHQHASDYEAVWWIPAERPEQIRQALVQLADRLGLQVGLESNVAVPSVLEALRTGRPCRDWLLVFDNAEELDTVRPFFPNGGPGRILVTSRNAQWSRAARTVEVDVFDREESIELLRRRGPELPDEQADRVAEALGDLPLAIEQAAAWLTETGMPVDEYLHVFEDERTDVSTRRAELLAQGVPVDYPEPVAAAWNMSLRRLAEHHPGALQLLQVCSFFAPEPISRRLFSGVRGVSLSPELSEVLQDPIKLGHAIREINRYALIKINHRNNTIEMHRLVQAVLMGQMSPQQQADMRHSAHVLLAYGDPNDVAPVNWPRYADLLSHVRASRAMECDDKWVRQMVRNLISFLFVWGDHKGAREFGSQVVETWRQSLGEDSLETLTASRTLGHALTSLGHYEEARELNNRILELLRAHPQAGENHEDTIATMGAVANSARLQGDYARSVELEKDRWTRALRVFGEEDPYTLAAGNDYGLALRAVGDFALAQEVHQSARDTAAIVLGEDSLTTILLSTHLSSDARGKGQYHAARAMQEETFARALRSVPPNAPVFVNAMRTLAVARRKAGDHEGAIELTRQALDSYRLRYIEPNLDITTAEMNLSMDLRQNADLAGARDLGRKSLEDLRVILGPRHPYTSSAATNLAVTLRLLGETEEALALNKETLPVFVESLGADHPSTLTCAINLASDLYTLADYEEAHSLDTDSLAACRERLGEDHPTTLACAVNLSADLRALGESRSAEELHNDALERFRRVLGTQHPATIAAARGIRADCDLEAYTF
ncbi:FxSxx-COOH system tetratricopeptide repeat protein [Streptomyces sp. ME19-01-6]|uniref:FxSxx-COOH system tetratricopeptide repeat protein n=1 Tax=Streptomyces sp. ME19-01-6 TaxID=3028686 RepID=UPI0029A88847|nr:FxSxx-COOH system tetratricopeptide repeat protein [Streptomyces sp. ME19-01-6]MDX3228949.1 FxSxx-COOH system tetratricopeptide repeat protein [Streptomyces sp. ME19-01-6]